MLIPIDAKRAADLARRVEPVVTYPGYLTPKECEVLSQNAGGRQKDYLEGRQGKSLTHSALKLNKQTKPIFDKLCDCIWNANDSNFLLEPTFFLEGPPTVMRYEEKSQAFRGWHVDGYSDDGGYTSRKLSLSLQLSPEDAYTGGDLKFMAYHQPIGKNLRQQGTVVVFPAFEWHHVTKVTSGVRESLVMFACGNPFR